MGAPRLVGSIFAFGLLVLVAALLVPGMIDATQDQQQQTVNLTTDERTELTDYLDMTLDATNATAADAGNRTANVTYHQTKDLLEGTTSVNGTESTTLSLDSDTINTTVSSIEANSSVITAKYPPMMGWHDQARTFAENSGIILALLSMITILAGFAWGIRT